MTDMTKYTPPIYDEHYAAAKKPDLSPGEIRAGINLQMAEIKRLGKQLAAERELNHKLLTFLRDLGTYSALGAIISAELDLRLTKEQADAVRRLLGEQAQFSANINKM